MLEETAIKRNYVSLKDFNVNKEFGEIIKGEYLKTFRSTKYNNKTGEPFMSISHLFLLEDGSEIVLNGAKSLNDSLAKVGVKSGQKVSIIYDGMVPKTFDNGKTSNIHSVTVKKVS